MTQILLDASAVISWLVPGQHTRAAEALLDEAAEHDFEAPHIFPAEVRNVMLILERRGRMDASDTARALASLAAYRVVTAEPPDAAGYDDVLELARKERLTVYDGLYLLHALRHGLTIASRDGDLLAAALRNGLAVKDIRR
ncbi:MAG TPA: type II toxin-antitoxin system VapC family toxin [Caulobacteraceae bacterium]|nr:type II toxin-antitoxin system VapC family toxin [Caulobacteraceae bacterium]